jgi:hypothetical protein
MRIDLLPKLQWDFINRKKVTWVEFFLKECHLKLEELTIVCEINANDFK